MAKNKQSSGRFPHFKLFLFLALVVSLGLTTLAANTRTNIQQHAASVTCGPNGTAPVCPLGEACSYTAGNPNFGGTCVPAVITAAPTGLSASYTYCVEKEPASQDYPTYSAIVTFKWNKVNGATTYLVTLSDGLSAYHYATKTQGATTFTAPDNWTFVAGDNPYWQVQGYNTYTHQYGPLSVKQYINFKCNIVY